MNRELDTGPLRWVIRGFQSIPVAELRPPLAMPVVENASWKSEDRAGLTGKAGAVYRKRVLCWQTNGDPPRATATTPVTRRFASAPDPVPNTGGP